MAKKVGQVDAKKKEKKGRPKFDAPKSLLDKDGKLTAVPEDYDYRKFQPLKKLNFASEDLFLDYQGRVAEQKSKFFAELAKDRHERANSFRKFGDPEQRRKAKKLQRSIEAAHKLQKELEAQGIDVSEILAGLEDSE